MSFGNHCLNLILFHSFTHIHTYTQIHINNYYTKTLTKKHIHAEFMLQFEINRRVCALPFVFAFQIQAYPNGFCIDTIPSNHMFPSKLSVIYVTTHTHAQAHGTHCQLIRLPTTKHGVRPSFTHYRRVHTATYVCIYDFVDGSMCTANLLMNFCLTESMFGLALCRF